MKKDKLGHIFKSFIYPIGVGVSVTICNEKVPGSNPGHAISINNVEKIREAVVSQELD